jgi:Icc-related predicted phosphoesterase
VKRALENKERRIKKMKLLVLSDLHLGLQTPFKFSGNSGADIVILAGDIDVGVKGVKWAVENIPDVPVIYVLGNHEFYGNDYPDLIDKAREAAVGTNVNILENEMFEHEDVVFFGATLWTDFNLLGDPVLSGLVSKSRISDFGSINFKPEGAKIRPNNMIEIHRGTIRFLKERLNENIGKKVVMVTHHAPSMISIDDIYKKDHTSAVFASSLESFIENYEPELWIHGHVHHFCDYNISKTRIYCNPRGYNAESNYNNYSGRVIEI